MKEETINYDKVVLDPEKEVLVPVNIYSAILEFVNMTVKKHSKVVYQDRLSWFNKKTHQKLTKKLKESQIEKDYYQNFDLEATQKTGRPQRDELALAGIELQSEFFGVFKLNVDKGNYVERPETNNQEDTDDNSL